MFSSLIQHVNEVSLNFLHCIHENLCSVVMYSTWRWFSWTHVLMHACTMYCCNVLTQNTYSVVSVFYYIILSDNWRIGMTQLQFITLRSLLFLSRTTLRFKWPRVNTAERSHLLVANITASPNLLHSVGHLSHPSSYTDRYMHLLLFLYLASSTYNRDGYCLRVLCSHFLIFCPCFVSSRVI
jgi:hypothetical protein